jgi:hypothetical protein
MNEPRKAIVSVTSRYTHKSFVQLTSRRRGWHPIHHGETSQNRLTRHARSVARYELINEPITKRPCANKWVRPQMRWLLVVAEVEEHVGEEAVIGFIRVSGPAVPRRTNMRTCSASLLRLHLIFSVTNNIGMPVSHASSLALSIGLMMWYCGPSSTHWQHWFRTAQGYLTES